MDNLLESNERTLVIFDSVCSGLAECLALVHADIKQMTEHRNQLARLEQERLQAKISEPTLELSETDKNGAEQQRKRTTMMQTDLDVADSPSSPDAKVDSAADDDPHHLARLKLLDKRLADSFSQALSMCDQQKTSLVTRKQHYQATSSSRPSIFQVLLGKGGSKTADGTKRRTSKSSKGDLSAEPSQTESSREPDNRVVIDDINRQTRLAMQYSKQLEAHLFRVEDLRTKYEMHLKMGLVVKSVSRAYSSTSSSSNSASHPSNYYSPNSLGRRMNNCTSTLAINDTSSLGTTHSSLSSLNLSSWSFSRRNKSATCDRSSRKDSTASAAYGTHGQPAIMDDSSLSRHRHQDPSLQQNQRYVSTISLDSMSRRNKRLSLAKLISMSSAASAKQSNMGHNEGLENVDEQQQMQDMDAARPRYSSSQQPNQRFSSASNMLACQCQLIQHPDDQMPVIYGNQFQASPSPRPSSQYGDFIVPTTAGTMSRGSPGGLVYVHQHSRGGSAGGGGVLLHKSASHSSLKNIKGKMKQPGGGTTIKEFIDNIERIESEFESYMGSFLLNIEDIQGFARVCQGDVFEINIKYGQAQKFKTKISVLKDSRQKCDNRQTVFKSRIADVIAIKAYECKGLGKRVLLGHKLCETRDLFTARSQLMTISLNQTGSIKLNLVITWNPLHMAPNSSLALPPGLDISHISLPPTPVSSSTLSSLSSAQSAAGAATTLANGTNGHTNNSTTLINIQSSNQRSRVPSSQTPVQPPPPQAHLHSVNGAHTDVHGKLAADLGQQQHHVQIQQYLQQHQLQNHGLHQHRGAPVVVAPTLDQQARMYLESEPAYGYYIPEPDYLTSDCRH